jgi:predicted RNase H-like nuclease (RuvC/YqgF family)
LSNKEREALKSLPGHIKALEGQLETLTEKMSTPEYYQDSENDPVKDSQTIESLETEILESYERLEELEAL